jgi:hypothetical protein
VLAAAAIVLVVTALAHSVLGELFILRKMAPGVFPRLLRSDVLAARTTRATWHITTALGAAFIPILWHERAAPDPFVIDVIASSLAACGVIGIVVTRARHPGWIAFAVAAALAFAGAR